MGSQLSVPQVMLSVAYRVKRSNKYIRAKTERNSFLKIFLPSYTMN